jgi:hypothetical protein
MGETDTTDPGTRWVDGKSYGTNRRMRRKMLTKARARLRAQKRKQREARRAD